MPDFNNLLEAEAYYKEEAQAKAEHREPQHGVTIEPVEVHENSVFDPDPALAYSVTPDPEKVTESGSPSLAFEGEVAEAFDPAELTPIPHYNSDGTDATVESPVADEVIEADEPAEPTEPTESSDTPKE